ncbi:pilus assembly protein [Pseudomonas gingeri]|uniref:Pilus assembly protein n=1 Tax=Pseudomonas gingeri TaxID=117681 RepID=A0A7Y8C5J3_9PSED|nr:TadE/TadG family type IV pilus assembly protein [Pseudomonas gingeri]NWA25248.1 pilus assembly protein [Pseudomonas gingeri]NWB99919.1 pilus assembly protein [Pseudomonas gingeri]NWD68663.1 pilus assembly protein [Pseudomonas gingeri]NWD73567.1 pilus assembly protein [Pseudomonas gingeri]
MNPSLPSKQKGAAAIEFALVFVIFFGVFYGMVSYCLPLLMVQSFHEATAEALRRSVAVDPVAAGSNYTTLVQSTAIQAATSKLGWIPPAFNFNAASDITAVYSGGILTVTVNYPTAQLNNALPFLVLPGIGTVPNLPTNLTVTSSLQF